MRQPKHLLLLILLVIPLFSSCELFSEKPVELAGVAFGTTYSIKVLGIPGNIDSQQIHDQILLVMDAVDASMSVHNVDSELAKFNRFAKKDWFKISENLFQVINEAQQISKLSAGAFDVTIGNLVELWGFGKALPPQRIPQHSEIDRIKAVAGYTNLQLSSRDNSMRKHLPELTLNLSAIAKGFAVDSVADYLDGIGIQRYLVEIGGELRTKGLKQPGKPWLVAIERPETNKRSVYKIIRLTDMSMATSGDYRNYYDIEGTRFSHTINPFTGRPVENTIASVSVMDSSCMKADALATMFMSMGFEKGAQFAEDMGIPVLWILRTENGVMEKTSSHFDTNLFQ